MKIKRLILHRYGHLRDLDIVFPDRPGLHIVPGVNEAGKSTALSAIGDCLFRFPHNTEYDFLHSARDLRVGVTVQAADGREATFFRRKGRKDDLFDGQDRPVPESALAAYLRGATRERFHRVFGLDAERLRSGANELVKDHGDAGETVLGAHTGLRGFRQVLDRLDTEAGKLYGDRRGQKAFHEAAGRHAQARLDLRERQIEPKAWKDTRDRRDTVTKLRVDGAKRTADLRAERSRLDRIRRTAPARLDLTRLRARLEPLGPLPDLPPDAATRFRDAHAAHDQARRDIEREKKNAEPLLAELQALEENPPVLTLAEEIDDLIRRHQGTRDALNDRESQRLIGDQSAQRMKADGRQLGLILDADALAAKVPGALDRAAVAQALKQHLTLSTNQQRSNADVEAASAKRADSEAALQALPQAEDFRELKQAIATAREEGRLEADILVAETKLRSVGAELETALAALPLWDRDAAALAAVTLPLAADIQRTDEMMGKRSAEVERLDTVLAEHDRALGDLAAKALGDSVIGELPTTEAIQHTRDRRDQAWRSIRRAYLDGGEKLTADEIAILGSPPGDGFESLLHAADRLVDIRAAERERIVAAEQRRAEEVRRTALRDNDAALRSRAADALETAQAEWRALWQPSGIKPADPAGMREWLQRREAVLAKRDAALQAAQALKDLRARLDAAVRALSVWLPDETGSLATLLRRAELLCEAREAAAAALTAARKTIDAARSDLASKQRGAGKIEADLAAWRQAWMPIAASLSLPPDTAPETAETALRLWDEIDKTARQRRDALDRVAQMTKAIEQFNADTLAVVRQVAPDLEGTQALDAVTVLAGRLQAARADAKRRQDLSGGYRKICQAIEQYSAQETTAADRLDALRRQAGAPDNDALADAIRRWSEANELMARIKERETELRGLDDGKTLDELAAEADGLDIDMLPARIAAIEAALQEIADQDLIAHTELADLNRDLAAMEAGRDAAAAAQAMETAAADLEDIAERYVKLRLAHRLLSAGMERFRRQQQGPLLQRASVLFRRLTEGRYDRLETEETDQGDVAVIARRPDGSECQLDRLSEGTRDQLYLALRLAAIATDAAVTEPLPFIGDDLLVNFDDRRARAAIQVLSDFAATTQVILFTHHGHIAEMATPDQASVHWLPDSVVA